MKIRLLLVGAIFALIVHSTFADARPVPRADIVNRLRNGGDIIGIVHWGLNTFTDREWGYGDEDPAILNPKHFDADQIVRAAADAGIWGLVVVAKHHDGFCLWPTKTTPHNITRSPFRGGKGDYVGEMAAACRRAGLRFGVYCSPWDRNNAAYATQDYVKTYHAQVSELNDGRYGEIFEMWFDGANGGDGWYGGSKEKRKIPAGYYRFDELFARVRSLQPKVTFFGIGGEFAWPGNELGVIQPEARATTKGSFSVYEADFPLRKGWFYHADENGTTRQPAYLMKIYLSSVGNGGTMDIGLAPTKDGVLDDDDVSALRGFGEIRRKFFAHEVKNPGEKFNVVVLEEDLSAGQQVDGWSLVADGREIISGKAIGVRRVRVLPTAIAPNAVSIKVTAHGGDLRGVSLRRYFVDENLLDSVLGAKPPSVADKKANHPTITLEGEYPGHLQDIWMDGNSIWWAHTQWLVKTDLSGKIVAKNKVGGHHAGLEVKGSRLFTAVCGYDGESMQHSPKNHLMIGEYDAATLRQIEMHVIDINDRAGSFCFLEDGTMLVGCLRNPALKPTEVKFHHLDKKYRLIKTYVVDVGMPVNLGIEVIKRHGKDIYLFIYGGPTMRLSADTLAIIGRYRSFGGQLGFSMCGKDAWIGESLMTGGMVDGKRQWRSCIVRKPCTWK